MALKTMIGDFEKIQRTVDVGVLSVGAVRLAVDVFIPTGVPLHEPAVAFFCVPGGGLNRRYFDLPVADDVSFSFAAQMAKRGMITVAIDPLGVGGSSRPAEGFDIVPDVATAALGSVHRCISAELRAGTFAPTLLPALPKLFCVGVGHSLGGMQTVMQQAQFHSYDALVLLGFGPVGMPEVLSEEAKAIAHDPQAIRSNVVRLARTFHSEPYPEVKPNGRGREIFGGGADPRAMNALRAVQDRLLATLSMFVIIPGSCAPECARIDVPLLLAVGDRDMCGPPHQLPAYFAGSSDVTLLCLPNTGHSHFVFSSTSELFARLAHWTEVVAAMAPIRLKETA
jgi:pimeloyl-ACP methyl ester carboxylesterase